MCQETVSFHFSETNTTLFLTTFHWLMSENIDWTSGSCLGLITYHVSKSLIIYNSQININFHFFSKNSWVHILIPKIIKAVFFKFFSKEINNIIILIFIKCFYIYKFAIKSTPFCCQGFNKHADCHTRWESMWINNNIWCDTLLCERHIFLWPNNTHNTFLAMPWREFITNYRISSVA